MHSRKYLAVALTAAMTLTVGSAFAQTSLGILAGVARDTTGAVVANATVTIVNTQNGQTRTVKTSSDGSYRIDAISTGKYNLSVSEVGFDKAEVKDVTVVASSVTSYDVVLTVGQANTELTVEADNATINTENGTLTGVVGALEIDKLPIFSLNPIELATTLPGVQTVSNGGSFSNGVGLQVNGARPRANNFLLDGQEINDVGIGGQAFQPQIPDIFDSLDVITNSASAEYGRAGGGVINLITKSGTNTFHGTVFERYTGSGLNSVPGGFRGSPFNKTRSDQHSYGFTAGGPIIKNKLFAFGALELQRFYGRETPGINLLPDAAGYALLQTITGPAAAQVQVLDQYLSNGSYLTQDIVYGPSLDPTTHQPVPIKRLVVAPGCPVGGCQVTFAGFQRPSQPETSPDTQWMYRVDYRPWDKDSLSFRYLHDRSSLTPDFFNNGGALAGFDTLQGGPTELGEGQWTHVFSPTLLNEFRVSEARLAFTFAPTAETLANPLNSLPSITFGDQLGSTVNGSQGFPTLGPNQNFPQGRKESLYQFQDTVGLTKGRQSFRMGTDIGRQLETDLVSQNALGTVNIAPGGVDAAGNATGNSALGNFILNQTGPSGSVTKTFGKTRVDPHGFRNGFFLQDDIKFSADLTLNFGVRYDFLTDPENSLQYPGIDIKNPFAPINTVVKVKGDYNNISPRLGFAYSPHGYFGFLGDGKTVLRGGFGIFYDSTFSNILVNSNQSSPNAVAASLQLSATSAPNGITNPTAQIATLSPNLTPFNSVLSESSNLVNPLTYQYNLGIERELPGATVLSVRYVGNRGEKLFANQQYNPFQNGGGRINPTRGAVTVRGNFADSNYNSAEVDVVHNFAHGLLLRANYIFSKDLDDGSEIFTTFSQDTSYSANLLPGGRGQDYGPSAYDHRQYFSVAYVYSPKGLRSDNKFTDAALGVLTRHWTIAGVSQLQSGAYATISTTGLDTNGDNNNANDRPLVGSYKAPIGTAGIDGIYLGPVVDVNGNVTNPIPGQYYDLGKNNTLSNTDPNSLTPVTPNQVRWLVPYGPQGQFLHQEIGRNSYQTPGTTTHLLALEKGIGLSYLHLERGVLLLRAEAQNVFNHNDGAQPSTDVLNTDVGFLSPIRTGSNRTLVLWAKFQF